MLTNPPSPGLDAREAATLSALYAALFAVTGIAQPFLPVWLHGLGLDAGVLGFLLALPILVRIVVTAPLTGLVDWGVSGRRLGVLASLAQAATFALLPLAALAPWPVLALALALNAVAQAPLVPVADYLTLRLARRSPRHAFARLRLAGSLSFLVANLAAGWWLAGRAGAEVVWLLAILSLAGVAAGLALPREPRPAPAPSPVAAPPAPAEATGARARALRLAILAGAAGQASHAAVYAVGASHWSALGLSSGLIGLCWATGVLAEIAVFAFVAARPAWRERAAALLAAGALAGGLRWAGLALAGDAPAAILALQLLHGLSFGATLLGSMAAVSRLAPEGARGRAQGRLGAATALASAAATLASGFAYRRGGGGLALALMLPLSAAELALACALHRRAPSS